MKIATDTVVSIDYVLKDDLGDVIDSSEGQEPLEYIHGHGQLVPGLERQLEGREPGESLKVQVAPAEGYGEHDPKRVVQIDRSQLPEDLEPEIGMELSTEGPDGDTLTLWVTEVSQEGITLDGNHPLAGQTLHFAIDIRNVRPATEAELSCGHVHTEGVHEH